MDVNRSAPTATIVPILIYEDVGQAIDWLCRAFGFSERLRAERGGVIGHAQLAVAEGAIMLGRQGGPLLIWRQRTGAQSRRGRRTSDLFRCALF
jgi:hypothetical protein